MKRGHMVIQVKKMMLVMLFAVMVAQLGGCIFERHERRDEDHGRHHDRGPDHAALDIRVH